MKNIIKNYIDTQLKQDASFRNIYPHIKNDLNEIEKKLKLFTRSSNPIISEISSYLFQKAGKRVRPALLVLWSKHFDYKGKEHILMAALVETIHTASLIHDDIIDKSDLRRGRETVHAKWGPNITVLLGDYLYIKALNLSLSSNYGKIIQILTDISSQMIEGELDEYYMSGNLNVKEEEYLDILNKKTAALFSASCQIGGVLGNASIEEENSLIEFGRNIGISFQIIDDLLDFTGDEKTLGKPILSDLNEGRITLPLIYTLNHDGSSNRKRISDLLKKENPGKNCQEEILDIVKSNGALDYTYNKATEFSLKSKEIINSFSQSSYRDALAIIPDFILTRNK